MDSKRLTEIEERCEKLPDGKWEAQIPAMTGEWPSAKIKGLKIVGRLYGFAMIPTDVAEFVAHSKEDLPDLVAAYKLLRADAAELARHLHHARHCPYGIGRTKSGNEPWVESPCCCGVAELLSRPSVVNLLKEKD